MIFRLPPQFKLDLLFWDVTQHRLVLTDVSGQPIGPIFSGQKPFKKNHRIYFLINVFPLRYSVFPKKLFFGLNVIGIRPLVLLIIFSIEMNVSVEY